MGNCRGERAICSREWLTAPPYALLPQQEVTELLKDYDIYIYIFGRGFHYRPSSAARPPKGHDIFFAEGGSWLSRGPLPASHWPCQPVAASSAFRLVDPHAPRSLLLPVLDSTVPPFAGRSQPRYARIDSTHLRAPRIQGTDKTQIHLQDGAHGYYELRSSARRSSPFGRSY
jgi:hypothetical protein